MQIYLPKKFCKTWSVQYSDFPIVRGSIWRGCWHVTITTNVRMLPGLVRGCSGAPASFMKIYEITHNNVLNLKLTKITHYI